MANASIVFDLIGRDRASDKFDDVGKSADKSGGKMAKFGKLAKVAAAGSLLAAGGLFKLAQGAAEDAAGQARLAKALQNSTGATNAQVDSVESWISKQGKALGVADDKLRPALEKLAMATGDVGKSQKLASLAMDVSAGSGKSLDAVSTALAKAQNGNVAALSKLGISTKDAEGKTVSFAEAQRRLASAHGGQAATAANTLQGKLGRLKLALGEAGETIGAKLLPPTTKLATFLVANLGPGIDKTSKFLGEHKTELKVAAIAIAGFGGALLVANVALWAYAATSKIVTVATKAWAAGQWVLNAALTANPLGLVVVGLVALGAGLVLAYKKSQTFRAIVQGALGKVRAAGAAVASFFTQKLPAAFGKVKDAAGNALGWVRKNWPKILAFLTGPIGIAVLVITRHWGKIKAGAGAAKEFVVGKFNALVGFVTGLPGRIGRGVSGMFNGVKEAFRSALNWIIDKWNGFELRIGGGSFMGKDLPSVTLSTPNVPRFARGGITPGGTVLVGEQGAELVDLPRGSRVSPHGASMARLAGGGGTVINIHVSTGVGDPVTIGKQIEKTLVQAARNLGRPLEFPVK